MNYNFKNIAKLLGAKKLRDAYRYMRYCVDFYKFQKLSYRCEKRFDLNFSDRYPCINDNTVKTGFDRHYVFHTAWAARILARTKPEVHFDISSSLYFASIASAFIPITFYDYRPADLNLSGLNSKRADLLNLPFKDNSIASLSCMHVVEHIGLGRYGDPFDPVGDLKAMSELIRVLARGGGMMFVVPIGKPKIMFNAHRIYSYSQIIEYFRDLELVEFSLICDDEVGGNIVQNASARLADDQKYGCGLFWFRKSSL